MLHVGPLRRRFLSLSVQSSKGDVKRIPRDGGWKRIKFNPNYYPEHSTGNPLKHFEKELWQRNPKVANNAHNVAKFYKEHKHSRFVRIYDDLEGERYYQNNHWQVHFFIFYVTCTLILDQQ